MFKNISYKRIFIISFSSFILFLIGILILEKIQNGSLQEEQKLKLQYSETKKMANDLLLYSEKVNSLANYYYIKKKDDQLRYFYVLIRKFKNEEKLDFSLSNLYYFMNEGHENINLENSYRWKKKLFSLDKISDQSRKYLINYYYLTHNYLVKVHNAVLALNQSKDSILVHNHHKIFKIDTLTIDSLSSNIDSAKLIKQNVVVIDTIFTHGSKSKIKYIQKSIADSYSLFKNYDELLSVLAEFEQRDLQKINLQIKYLELVNSIILWLLLFSILIWGIFLYLSFGNIIQFFEEKFANIQLFSGVENKVKIPYFTEIRLFVDKISNIFQNQSFIIDSLQKLENQKKLDLSESKLVSPKLLTGITNLSSSISRLAKESENTLRLHKEENWINEALAEFNEVLRTEIDYEDINKSYFPILKAIIKLTKANQGGLFIKNKDENGEYLELVSSYAYDIKRTQKIKIDAGDGILGSILYEKKPIYLDNLPENYVSITSGIGEATPKYLFIQPFVVGHEVVGAVELASFNHFLNYHQKFMLRVAENLSSVIASLQSQEEMKSLLHHSQNQSESLALQEEELRQNLEELKATQEDILKKETEIHNFEDQINNSFLRAEIDLNTRFLTANPSFLRQFNLKFMQLDNLTVSAFLTRDMEEIFMIKWKNLLRKNSPIKIQGKFAYNNIQIEVLVHFLPVLSAKKELKKVIILGSLIE